MGCLPISLARFSLSSLCGRIPKWLIHRTAARSCSLPSNRRKLSTAEAFLSRIVYSRCIYISLLTNLIFYIIVRESSISHFIKIYRLLVKTIPNKNIYRNTFSVFRPMRCFFAYLAGFEIVGSIVSSVVKYECKGSWNRKPSLSSSPNDHDITVALHISTAAKVRKGIAKLRRTCAYTQPRDAPIHLHARSIEWERHETLAAWNGVVVLRATTIFMSAV